MKRLLVTRFYVRSSDPKSNEVERTLEGCARPGMKSRACATGSQAGSELITRRYKA